jgi:hypothetical protein
MTHYPLAYQQRLLMIVKKKTKSCTIQSISISLNMLHAQLEMVAWNPLSYYEKRHKNLKVAPSVNYYSNWKAEFKDQIDLILLVFYFSKCSSRVINHRIWNCMAHACQFVTIVSNWSFCYPSTTLAKIAYNLLVQKLGRHFWKWKTNCK